MYPYKLKIMIGRASYEVEAEVECTCNVSEIRRRKIRTEWKSQVLGRMC